MAMANATVCDDGSFGPTVQGCRGDFDFTLLFEQSFFLIAPSSVFLLLSAARLSVLRFRRREVSGTIFQLSKLAAIGCYGAVQIALLVFFARPGSYTTRTSLPAATLAFVDVFVLGALSWFEHAYSPRPSALINVYLLLSVLFDAVQARTLWLKRSDIVIPALFTTSLVIKFSLLVLESAEKGRFLSPIWRERSPEEKSGIFSQGLLLWLRRILAKGRKRILSPTDLYALDQGLETTRLSEAFWESWSSSSQNDTPLAIVWVLVRTLKWPLLAPVAPRLAQGAFTICQPLLLRSFLLYLEGERNFVGGTGPAFIGAYALVYFGLAISTCSYWRLTYRSLVKMRGCLIAAIYKKTTEIDTAKYDMTAPVALMSTDMERFIQGCKDLHEIWANTAQVAISVWLLYGELGVVCVAPAVVAVVSSIGSVLMSSYADKSQVKWMESAQERVAATAKVIAAMKGVKLLGLSEGIYAMLGQLRAAELHAAKYFRYIEVLTATVSFTPLLLSPVFTFMIFVLQAQSTGTNLNTTVIFTSLSLLHLMTQPLVWLFQAIPLFVASLGCLGRIGKYLQAHSKTEKRNLGSWQPTSSSNDSRHEVQEQLKGKGRNAIIIRDGELGWTDSKPILKAVNIEIPASKLTLVIGPVASGKSTLSKAIIGELPSLKGEVRLDTESSAIAYCDQEPFLMNGTLQENILGCSDFDSAWYDVVVRAVDLDKDISSLPDGGQTRIGSKGVSLSGGQRQRISIARAVYAQAPITVFDDSLSGLDARTKEHVFEHVFSARGLLRKMGRTTVLFTHDVDLLPRADHIVALSRHGRVANSGTFEYLGQASEYIKSLTVRERPVVNSEKDKEVVGVPPGLSFHDDAGEEPPEDMMRRLGDSSIYSYFFGHIGLWQMLLFAVFQCGWAVFSTIGPLWLKFWAADNVIGKERNNYYIGVYATFQTLALVFLTLFAGHTLTTIAVKAGSSLHEVMLKTVMQAPMSFFSTVDVGITTNRFSQDIILIDGELPMALLETVSAGLVAIVQLIIIATAAPYVAIAYPFLIGALYGVQGFYLRTSRQLRFLDLEAKSPLYTHFLETLHGLATIRAFGWSEANNELNHKLVDGSQRPLYLLYMVQRWLQLALDLMIAITAVVLIAVAVQLRSSSTGFIGVALINLMSISQELKMFVMNWTNLETSLGAIVRTKSFEENIPSENQGDTTSSPSLTWPQSGSVHLDSISADYNASEKANVAFRDVSIHIKSGQKVAICGRSGSGKSSLVMALARLLDLTSGTITIDGLDVSTVPRSTVRSALNMVPQEPYFFYKKVAENLDPFGVASPAAMCSALKMVQLWDVIEANGGLDSELDIETLSQGQKQLLALARAVLRPSKIVVLDEATSNVDRHTEDIMQRIIREEFQGRTVIGVAHQLSTIIDFDLVMVMDAGELAECGRPIDLLRRESLFKRLCDLQGIEMP
ncbi:hypothetical protein DL762_002765 [Monosporascus cannonballus]|uniref:ABC transporter n=1 Tax=Monosporascus cannonballus TaxID=155416 RepID=A0ABY0HCF9_9PEZI|nr:hypothetical protein DL762_002765 [Monosporascus cannonballus]